MTDYRLSHAAQRDYMKAFDYIAEHNMPAALKWETRMLRTLDRLADFPNTGTLRPDYAPAPLRLWFEGDYLILYNPSARPIEILAILHGAQEISSLIAARITDPHSDE